MNAFYIIGSSAGFSVFPGVSDVNFILVLQPPDKLSDIPSKVIQKAIGVFHNYKDNPMFTTLVDFEIVFPSQMPMSKSLGSFKALRAVALKNALRYSIDSKKFVSEEGQFVDLDLSKQVIKDSAQTLVTEHLTAIANALAEPVYEDDEFAEARKDELDFMCIEAVLLATQAYFMVRDEKYVSKVDLAFICEEEKLEGIDAQFLNICTLKRQGADYAGGYNESNDDEEQLEEDKKTGVIYHIEDMPSKTIDYLASISGLIDAL